MEKFNESTKYLSMWKGYVNTNTAAFNKELSNALGCNFIYIHTSEHADNETLKQLFYNTKHKAIIPMHTDNPELFTQIFPTNSWKVKLLKDKETINLNNL